MQNKLFDEFEAIYKLSERKIGGSYKDSYSQFVYHYLYF